MRGLLDRFCGFSPYSSQASGAGPAVRDSELLRSWNLRLSRSSGLVYLWPSGQKWERPSLSVVCQALARPTARQTTKNDRLSHQRRPDESGRCRQECPMSLSFLKGGVRCITSPAKAGATWPGNLAWRPAPRGARGGRPPHKWGHPGAFAWRKLVGPRSARFRGSL